MTREPYVTPGSLFLGSLLRDVRAGELRIPSFQRPFVWSSSDVILLLDSIQNRFPIGSLLLWRDPSAETPGTITIGPIEAAVARGASWVIDGQQRITALATALCGPGYLYNVESDSFEVGEPTRPTDIAAEALCPGVSQRELIRWQRRHADLVGNEVAYRWLERSDRARQLFQETIIGTITIEGPLDYAREVFKRANTAGRPFTESEVFVALEVATDG